MQVGFPLGVSKQSLFATAIESLLDDTAFFKRVEWASFLGISESAISQWVNDRTVPRADLLRMVLDLLRTRGGQVAAKPLADFDSLCSRPAKEISPLGSRMNPTVGDYIKKVSLVRFARELQELSNDDQQEVLIEGGWAVQAEDKDNAKKSTQVSPAAALHADLLGKNVLVLGVDRGLGSAIVRNLAQLRARVEFTCLGKANVDESLVRDTGALHVSLSGAIGAEPRAAILDHGLWDVLVSIWPAPTLSWKKEGGALLNLMDAHLSSTLEAVRRVNDHGKVIFLMPASGHQMLAAGFAMRGLKDVLAVELQKRGIAVGTIQTGLPHGDSLLRETFANDTVSDFSASLRDENPNDIADLVALVAIRQATLASIP